MSKETELLELDGLVRKKMLDCLKPDGNMGELTLLNTVVQYLTKNNAVSDKSVSTIEDDTKKRLKEASARRKNNVSR